MSADDARAAIESAHAAQEPWAHLTARERSNVLWEWHRLILKHSDDLVAILAAKMGKPLVEAKSEVQHAAAYLQWFAEEASRIYGETISAPSNDRRMLVIKQPIGVVGAITPWNFPASMVARKISAALAAGCMVVLKPAEQTPLVAGAMFALAKLAGFPEGVLNLVYASDGDARGRGLSSHPKVRKVSFTGSTEVALLLMRQCSDQVKPINFELGGNAPFIVFDDTDIDTAVDGAIDRCLQQDAPGPGRNLRYTQGPSGRVRWSFVSPSPAVHRKRPPNDHQGVWFCLAKPGGHLISDQMPIAS